MTRATLLTLAFAAAFTSIGPTLCRAQDGNECSCSVVLQHREGGSEPVELYKESTSILGSLCTDADFEFCSGFCKQEMHPFTGSLGANYSPTNKTVGQSLCDMAKKPVSGGLIKIEATVCEQDAREIGMEQPQKLCCDKTGRWTPCSGQ